MVSIPRASIDFPCFLEALSRIVRRNSKSNQLLIFVNNFECRSRWKHEVSRIDEGPAGFNAMEPDLVGGVGH